MIHSKANKTRLFASFAFHLRGRNAATAVSLCITVLFAAPAAGQQKGDNVGSIQAEWAQNYDSDPRLRAGQETTPTLSSRTVVGTDAAIRFYEDVVARGGWNEVPVTIDLHTGSDDPAVTALRQRLAATGDLDPRVGLSSTFDTYVEAGVKRFQERHGLGATGIVSRDTYVALNIPADLRLKQLQANLVRLKSFTGNLGPRFVMANIPAASVETVENGVVYSHHVAGVGKPDRQSPILQAKAVAINFNPYWHVPASIIRKDLIPKMRADPAYLGDNNIHVYDAADREVSPDSIDWSSLAATKYKFREDPGTNNSMGIVRINIENPYGVFMHDTATKGIFGDDFRYISSGCIRVQNVREYVAWLLKDTPGWSRAHIDEAISSGGRIDAKLSQPVPVYWVYITAWATPDGEVQFRDDIYHRDGLNVPNALSPPSVNQPVEAALSQDQ